MIPDDRRGVCGRDGAVGGVVDGAVVDGAAGVPCGATDEARDQEGEEVVDRSEGGADGARDQPKNEVMMAVVEGSGGGDDLMIGDSPSLATSDSVCSLMEGSASTDAITPNRLFSCVEDFKKGSEKKLH